MDRRNIVGFLVLVVLTSGTFSVPTYIHLKNPKSSSDDAEILWNALQAPETDTEAIINVLAKRNLAERLSIIEDFKTLHNEDLIEDLKEQLSGDFENLVVALLTRLPQYYADELNRAMTGAGTDEADLVEILITLSNAQLKAASQIYSSTYGQTLEEAITSETSGDFKDLLISLTHAERDESTAIDEEAAATDANELYSTEDTIFGTFSDIFSHRSYPQLKLIFEQYESLAGDGIEAAITDNFSGDVEDTFLAIVAIVRNKPAYFAGRLYDSMSGVGTTDSDLTRVIVTRSEIDIDEIKQEYENLYSESLADAIVDDTSGDYQKCLLALIGE